MKAKIVINNLTDSNDLMKFLDLLTYFSDEALIKINKDKTIETYFRDSSTVMVGRLTMTNPKFDEFEATDELCFKVSAEKLNTVLRKSALNSTIALLFSDTDIKALIQKTKKKVELSIPYFTDVEEEMDLIEMTKSLEEKTKNSPTFEANEELAKDIDTCGKLTNDVVTFIIKSDDKGAELIIKNEDTANKFMQSQRINLLSFAGTYVKTSSYSAEYLAQMFEPITYTNARISFDTKHVLRMNYNIGNISLVIFLAPRSSDENDN
jgi:hypothetical protein